MAEINFIKNKIAAAIRTEKDFSAALRSQVDMIFLLHSNIMTLNASIREIRGAEKKSFVHVDFAEGIGRDRAGLEFLKKMGVDGICTTRTSLVKMAKDIGLYTVQRFFMIDSHSVGTYHVKAKLPNETDNEFDYYKKIDILEFNLIEANRIFVFFHLDKIGRAHV